jgi:hypothetical protein
MAATEGGAILDLDQNLIEGAREGDLLVLKIVFLQ